MFAEGLGTAILMFAILGIVDTRSPDRLAGLVIGCVVVGDHHHRRPDHRRVAQPGARVRPAARSAIGGGADTTGPAAPRVYILADLVGAAIAGFVYDWLAKPRRIVQRRSRRPSTEPDGADARGLHPRLEGAIMADR